MGGFRYLGEEHQPNLAVGLPEADHRTPSMLAAGEDPPMWVRWHRATTDAKIVQSRLSRAGFEVQRDTAGLLWYPLRLRPDEGVATRQRVELVRQVIDLYLAGLRPTT